MSVCSVAECERLAVARGWCAKHYQRWYSTGSVELRPLPPRCEVEGCTRPARKDDRCTRHYGVDERHPADWVNPLVCVCAEPDANPARNFGECSACRRKPLALMAVAS